MFPGCQSGVFEGANVTPGAPTKVIAGSMGLAAFSVAVIAGLAVGNPAETVLGRALAAMVACNALGWVVGAAAEKVASEAVRAYETAGAGERAGAADAASGPEVKGASHELSTS